LSVRSALGFMFLLSLSSCTGMDAALRMYGYIPLTPPSRLLKPGAIIFKKKSKNFEVGIICTPEQSLGPDFRTLESDTIPTFIENIVSKEFDLDADAMGRIAGRVGANTTNKVTVMLKNAKLVEINDWIVATYLSQRSPACTRMIKDRLAAGFEVTMVTSALIADAAYNVEWTDSGHSRIEARLSTIQALSGNLNGLSKNSSQNKFEAENMVWGVRTDSFLASMVPVSE